MVKRTKENDDEFIPVYIDEDGEEFVVLTDKKGISSIYMVRDLVIQQFGNSEEYDKYMEERRKELGINE